MPGTRCWTDRPDLLVEAGRGDRTLFRRSTLRGPAGDAVFTTVRMTYPSEDGDRWDAVAVAVTRSMKPAPGG